MMPFYALGKWVNVDDNAAPYQRTATLTSARPQGFLHGDVIGDKSYETVWKYMMTEEVKVFLFRHLNPVLIAVTLFT